MIKEINRRFVIVAYSIQIIFPVFLALDILMAWHLQKDSLMRPISDKILLVGCAVWIFVAIASALLINITRSEILLRVLLGFYLSLFTLVILEIGARIFAKEATPDPALRPPGTVSEFKPTDMGVPVPGVSRFTVNELGLRGPAVPKDRHNYRIVALGSSTTEDEVQDDSREWPHLLMEALNTKQKQVPVWVANAGVSGHTTVQNLTVMRTLPLFKQVDAILMVLGQTDMGDTLVAGGQPTQESLETDSELLRRSMLAGGEPVFDHPYYKRLRLYRMCKLLFQKLLSKNGKNSTTDAQILITPWRKRRALSPIRPLPDLTWGLSEYRQRVHSLANECSALRVRCIFITQPTLWRSDLSSEQQRLLWGGRLGQPRESDNKGYVSVSDLERAMRTWHLALLAVCAEEKLECLDLDAKFPKSIEYFYDDSHVTDDGARLYAALLAEYLMSKPPFSAARPSKTDRRLSIKTSLK